jgi:hypothetical protein
MHRRLGLVLDSTGCTAALPQNVEEQAPGSTMMAKWSILTLNADLLRAWLS